MLNAKLRVNLCDMSTQTRVYVPLGDEDLHIADRLHEPGSIEARALHELTGIEISKGASKAATFQALIAAGRAALEERTLQERYALQAAYEENHPDVQAWQQAMRGRHLRPYLDTREGSA